MFFWYINGANENDENDENEENSPNDKKVELKNFDFSTAIFSVLMWITYMMHGMVYFNVMKGSNEGNLQTFFYYFLRNPTLQFVFGLYLLNQNVSKVFYFIYMIPQAVLWPLAAIISYYVHQEDILRMYECFSCFNAFFAASLLFLAIKKYLPFQSYINDNISDKGFHLIFLSLGLIWYGVVMSLPNIRNDY